jgi:signal transduction histidine kinase
MNDPTESARRAGHRIGEINGRAFDPCIAASVALSRRDAVAPEIFLQRPDAPRLGSLPLRGRELGADSGRNNEFMPVFLHELRNCLGAIRNATGILRLDISAGPATAKARALIERQVAQMTRLLEDLLDASRTRSGQLRLQCERIDLCAVATQAAQTVEITMQQHHHMMITLLPSAPVWLQADPARLEQVFVNLLINAAKYTDAGGEVCLSVERHEGEAIVRIRDTGIGIDPDLLPHVFDLFVQADPLASRSDAGLGIGLALVRSLVERHSGCVTVASAGLGRGSEFTVRLPTE